MKRIRDRVAGLDVHRDTVVACSRVVDPDGEVDTTRKSFATTRKGLGELASFLLGAGVTTVAMEATCVYWKCVYYSLEEMFDELWLRNAQHVKNVPGRKTDLSDAERTLALSRGSATLDVGAHLAAAVVEHGLPFMRAGVELSQLLELIERGQGFAHQLFYRRPVVLMMMGDRAAARRSVDDELAKVGGRRDVAPGLLVLDPGPGRPAHMAVTADQTHATTTAGAIALKNPGRDRGRIDFHVPERDVAAIERTNKPNPTAAETYSIVRDMPEPFGYANAAE